MAEKNDKKISQLQERTELTGNEMIPFAEGGKNGNMRSGLFVSKDSMSDQLSPYAKKTEVDARIQQIIGTAPEALDTLGEIAERLSDDSDSINAINGVLAGKANIDDVYVKREVDTKVSAVSDTVARKADKDTVYTKTEVDDVLDQKANSSEVYTKEESDARYILKDSEYLNLLSYGVEFDTAVSSPACTRIGNMSMHRTLPIQSGMRGCLLADDGTVNAYLPAETWENSIRDGSAGQVMVEIPEFWIRFNVNGTKLQVYLSPTPISGFSYYPKVYVSAYEATVQRSTLTLCSIVNLDADFRGGNNKAEWDENAQTLLGKPATSINRINFRNYARKRKSGSTEWNCYTYDIHKTLFWLFAVEYATLNSQAAYNSEPTSEGYKQGGLGSAVTTLDYNKWQTYNELNPFIPCGYTDSLGNGTGVLTYQMPTEYDAIAKTVQVPRYRGIENPFGHIWKWTDGCNIQVSASQENGGTELSKAFVCHDPANFQDSNYVNYSHVGNIDRSGGFIKEVLFGVGGEILPKTTGGGSSTYFCDQHYTNIPTSGEVLRGLLFGGSAINGATAGLACAYSYHAPSYSHTTFGSRLCFIPSEA